MNSVRLWGDPFAESPAAARLRAFLLVCGEHGMQCALCLTAVRPPDVSPPPGTPCVELGDGARTLRVATALGPAELERVLRAVAAAVPASAPVVVFAEPDLLAEQEQTAALEWPKACRVVAADRGDTSSDLLARLRAELRWNGTQDPPVARDHAQLRPFLELPPPDAGGVIVHPGSADPADGTDLVLTAFAAAAPGRRLRIVFQGDDRERAAFMQRVAGENAHLIEVAPGPLSALHLRDAAVVLMPLRQGHRLEQIVDVLASGRPLCLSRFAATAALVPGPGLCEPIGGPWLPAQRGTPAHFAPDPRALVAALRRLLAEPGAARALGMRGRAHALAELCNDAPAPARALRCEADSDRPVVVLEAPLFEVSSSSELTIETARALRRRGNVELWLRPRAPFRGGVELLRQRAPELVEHLCREVRGADLWLSAGWPVRTDRPEAGCFAVRFDYEYGSLPVELSPVLTQEADRVVVHSTHVARTLMAAGRPIDVIALLPHGVDAGLFHEHAAPLPEVVASKRGLPAVLFTGGLVWRKGFDLFLRALLQATAAGARFFAVVKAVGSDQHYAGFGLQELVRKFHSTPGAPPLLLLEDDLSRSEMAGLYRACDLLLHPYRGEGFGMPVLEARACGLPVIVTSNGSTDDFCAGPGVVKIPSSRRPLELPGVHVSTPWVWEPEADAVGRLLVESLARLPQLQAEARAAASAVRATFSWEVAAEGIERIASEAMSRRAGALRAPLVSVPGGGPS